jgi:parvulin-like peptidyl-prolyl isomerase
MRTPPVIPLSFLFSLSVCACRSTAMGPQVETRPASRAQDPRVLAEAAGIRFTEQEYKDYLYTLFARTRLDEMVMDRLLALEAAELGIHLDEAELARKTREELRRALAEEFGGSEEGMRRTYEGQGFTPQEREAVDLLQRRRSALKEAIIRKTRTPSEERIRATFDRVYGVDGVQVKVRHLFVSAGVARRDLLQQGKRLEEIGEGDVDAICRRRIDEAKAALARGDAFEDVVRRSSQDEQTRALGGVIEGYNYQHYGVPFADAVRALEVGKVGEPVKSTSGWHLVRVDARNSTRLEDVRQKVVDAVVAEPPTLAELYGLEARLRAKHPITRPK